VTPEEERWPTGPKRQAAPDQFESSRKRRELDSAVEAEAFEEFKVHAPPGKKKTRATNFSRQEKKKARTKKGRIKFWLLNNTWMTKVGLNKRGGGASQIRIRPGGREPVRGEKAVPPSKSIHKWDQSLKKKERESSLDPFLARA